MWILPQHHQQIERFDILISMLESSDSNALWDIRSGFISRLESNWRYTWRQNTDVTSAWNHNIDEAFFYGLIYKFNKKIFISEYGKIIHKVWNEPLKRWIVFLYALFNIQFYHPAKKSVEAKLYPFRILFQVLMDSRIGGKISHPEMYFLYKLDELCWIEDYEELIWKILHFRGSNLEIKDYFRWNESDFIKCQCSASYCLWILKNFWFFTDATWVTRSNQSILSPNRRDATSVNINYIFLDSFFCPLIQELLEKYSIYEIPRNNPIPSDLISEIFNFIDDGLYTHLWMEKAQNTLLADEIYECSINPDKCYEFEIKINQAMRLFYNVKSEVVWWPSEPDFVASYMPEFPTNGNQKIFTGDAKSTKNQLTGINAGRLKQHMRKYHSSFTILVTPKYSPASKKDILGENIVILSSLALSEVTRQIQIRSDRPDFWPFYELIENNLWQDISEKFYAKIDEIYWINV